MRLVEVVSDSSVLVLPCECEAHTCWETAEQKLRGFTGNRVSHEGGTPVFITTVGQNCARHRVARHYLEEDDAEVTILEGPDFQGGRD